MCHVAGSPLLVGSCAMPAGVQQNDGCCACLQEVLEEQDIMRHITQKQALKAVKELAQDVTYAR